VSKSLSAAILIATASAAWSEPPPYVSRIGSSSPQSGTGAQGFSSLFPNAAASTPGMARTASRFSPRGGLGAGGFGGGRFGGSAGYGRNGVRPPIPTPPTQLGGYRGFNR